MILRFLLTLKSFVNINKNINLLEHSCTTTQEDFFSFTNKNPSQNVIK